MSLWTPGGEHPVDRGGNQPASPDPASPRPSGPAGGAPNAGGPPPDSEQLTPEQEAEARDMAAEMQAVREQLGQVPAAQVIANHAMGCWELAAIHLSAQPPKFDEASLAIDAFGALVEVVKGRLGEDEATLNDALAQLRLAFVQVKASADQGGDGAGATPDTSSEQPT